MRHSDSGHVLLELVVEAEACSAYQVVVGEVSCKPDQATMVVPRVSVCCRCSGGGVSDGGRGGGGGRIGMERWYNCLRRDQGTVELKWLPG